MKCKNCGAEVGIEYRLCPYCRSEVDYPERNNNQQQQPVIIQNIISNTNNSDKPNYVVATNKSHKNRMVALLLCIFGGVFGLHHFYAGKIGTGILYLFTGGLFCIGWLYDIFKILSGTYCDSLGLRI